MTYQQRDNRRIACAGAGVLRIGFATLVVACAAAVGCGDESTTTASVPPCEPRPDTYERLESFPPKMWQPDVVHTGGSNDVLTDAQLQEGEYINGAWIEDGTLTVKFAEPRLEGNMAMSIVFKTDENTLAPGEFELNPTSPRKGCGTPGTGPLS